jgi:type IV pilus assembly protein PilA
MRGKKPIKNFLKEEQTMKPELQAKYLQFLSSKKNKEEGFTLIELLVVVIIIGVLAAVALPNLLKQVGKARETELKNAVGTINRSQQSYHFEKQAFATTIANLGVTIPTQYIDSNTDTGLGIDGSSTTSAATVAPVNTDSTKDGTRAYSGMIAYADGQYSQVICQSNDVTDALTAPGTPDEAGCTASGGSIVK